MFEESAGIDSDCEPKNDAETVLKTDQRSAAALTHLGVACLDEGGHR